MREPESSGAEMPQAPASHGARRRRWGLLLLPLVLLLAAGAGGGIWARAAGWSLDHPQALGIAPPPGARDVPGDAPITIAFNMPMNPDSVRAGLRIDPPLAGTASWDHNTLVFRPQPGFQRGMTYTVSLGAGVTKSALPRAQRAD